MVTNYNDEERNALRKKEQEPDSEVICPRCGKPLTYRAVGNSCEIKCPTENCLKRIVRGL